MAIPNAIGAVPLKKATGSTCDQSAPPVGPDCVTASTNIPAYGTSGISSSVQRRTTSARTNPRTNATAAAPQIIGLTGGSRADRSARQPHRERQACSSQKRASAGSGERRWGTITEGVDLVAAGVCEGE